MKKQVAFLMASMMTLSLVPATKSFAASTNDLERSVQNVPEKTMLLKQQMELLKAKYDYLELDVLQKNNDVSDDAKIKFDTIDDFEKFVMDFKNACKSKDDYTVINLSNVQSGTKNSF